MNAFIRRHEAAVTGVLHGFDRVRIRGSLRWLYCTDGMGKYLSVMKVLLKDFKTFAQQITDRLRRATEELAEKAGRPLQYLSSPSANKEQTARSIAERDGVTAGPICVLSAVEPCLSYQIQRNPQKKILELRLAQRKCLHYYHYWIHPEWGFMHARLQTWFPFNVHVCLNGREWLARQMDRAGIDYLRRENCFVQIADVKAAQRWMDRQLRTNWSRTLENFLPKFHPLYPEMVGDGRAGYYWSVDSSEWATDVMFKSPAKLAALYPRLIQHGITHFGSRDVLRFLGRKISLQGRLHPSFAGEVVTDLRERPEGLRIKHRVNQNSIKMYDKQGSVLRVETTLNKARDMRVYRSRHDDPGGPKSWRILRKSVADIYRRAEVCQAANERYLDALAAVEEAAPLGQLVEAVCRPAHCGRWRVRAINPLSREDAALLQTVNRGEFAVNGFRNRDLRVLLYPDAKPKTPELRRQSAAVSRKLRLLRAHGLIRKVPRTHRYVVSPNGKRIIAAILAASAANTAKLMSAA